MTISDLISVISLIFTIIGCCLAFDSYMESKKKNDR